MSQYLFESELLIRPLQPQDIPQAVAVHKAAFPNFFLTFLGLDFLKLLYRFYITSTEEIALGVSYHNQIIGTLLGTTQPQKFYRRLANKYFLQFALAAFKPFLKKPTIFPRLVRGLFYRGDHPDFDTQGALLSSICVDVPFQDKGIGRRLVCAFEREIFQRGVKYAYLVTDRENNEKTRSFYEKMGWTPAHEFTTREGRSMVVLSKIPNAKELFPVDAKANG